ncbi:tetratricopeptide repeat protein [Jeotgalibacillus terrae]|uniref:Tetratricopeptide repeat protein n=1 Tax=Jeotgalibacillus terrae TaxID=587735 RepID=A0ABW5ZFR4_9BACL|nr:tetratricopeptide repeat protein [Jeotgalibacillus terrae]MBM7580073.1 tetratricopeptide (TPR) repeat protein [Jeotgalibacillus terrae]
MKKGSDHQKGKLVPFTQTGESMYKRGMAIYQKGQLEKAVKYLGKAAELEPEEPMIALQIAMIETELGHFQESNERLKRIFESTDPSMTEVHYFMANNYAHLGLFQEAYRHVNKYLDDQPEGEFSEDAEDLLDLLEFEDEDGFDEEFEQDELIVHQEKAGKLLADGKFNEAIEVLEGVVERFPDYWSAYNNLALAYFYQGDTEQASAILTEVLNRNPGNLHALCNLAVYYHYEGRDQELKALTKALETVRPFLIEHRFKLGATFALLGQYEQAYAWLRSLLKRGFEGDGGFYYWLSHSAWQTGHKKAAEDAWKRVIEEQPDKAGQEPWNRATTRNDEKLKTFYPEERMFILFKDIQESDRFLKEPPPDYFTQIETDYYMMLQTDEHHDTPISRAHSVAGELLKHFELNEASHQGLFYMWFHIVYHGSVNGYPFTNIEGLAAAVEYLWRKVRGSKLTQKEIAAKYGVAPGTLARYKREIECYLP